MNSNNYFVDESGDLTLFNKKGRIIVGSEGVSNYFMLGAANISAPKIIHDELNDLRNNLLSDPYFKDVPSMQLNANKTAVMFHANEDLPEVRREVFNILIRNSVKVQVIIRRKQELAEYSKYNFELTKNKIKENTIYDDLVKRLFRNLLHKVESNNIYFSKRGKKERTEMLQMAIKKAQSNFEFKYKIKSDKTVKIISSHPKEHGGLQLIDYYLWALQRMYERKEDRFFNLLKDNFSLIIDLDDKRRNEYGEYYSSRNQLTIKKMLD